MGFLPRIGLFADGIVGAEVLSILARRCPDRLSYIVAPSHASLIEERCRQLGLERPILAWDDDKGRTLPLYQDRAPEIVLLAWWPHIVRRPFLTAGQSATLNFHPSLLPYGRGKDPNFWALADREPYGVTIHHVDEGVDTGDIAFQAPLDIGWEDSGETLYARAQDRLIALFETALDAILSLQIPRIPQRQDIGSFHKRAQLAPRSTLDLDAPASCREVLDLLRARTFASHPACRFSDGNATYEVRIQIQKVDR